jgi:hypothetical protein
MGCVVDRGKILVGESRLKLSLLCLGAWLVATVAQASIVEVTNIQTLKALDPGPTCEKLAAGDMAIVSGYYEAGDRGGGWFMWQTQLPRPLPEDGGRYLAPLTNAGCGRWVRLLNGETPNVRMWGAKGDGVSIDSGCIQKALNACVGTFSGEMLFPSGTYLVNTTMVFSAQIHLRGEGNGNNSRIVMVNDYDVFRTQNAQRASEARLGVNEFDEDLIFENLFIDCGAQSVSNAALVVSQPGEAQSIRSIYIFNGGYGVRVLGNGTPGLRIRDSSIFNTRIANISIEGMVHGKWLGGGGPISLIGVSGDHRRVDSDETACFLKLDHCFGQVSIYDMKAEGQYGGGVIQYRFADPGGNAADTLAAVSIYGGSYNHGWSPPRTNVPCDFVVLQSDGLRSPSVYISSVLPNGVRYLIRDDVTGRKVAPNVGSYIQARVPILYESTRQTIPPRTRLIIADSAIFDFFAPRSGWYRVMSGPGTRRLTGRLVISSQDESTDLDFDIVAGASGTAALNVRRPSKDSPNSHPRVTRARLGTYGDRATSGTFLDVYIERTNVVNVPIVFAEPLEGLTQVHPARGWVDLIEPTLVAQPAPPGTVLYDCVTNALTR